VKIRFLSVVSVCIVAVVFAGCGGTSGQSKKAKIAFQSPVLVSGKAIPARYTCNAQKIWLPVQWGALPPHTAELVLYIGRYSNSGSVAAGKLVAPTLIAQSLVIGLKPTLHGLAAGNPPKGALIGYYEVKNKPASLCPPKGATQNFLFRLYALPAKLNISKGSQSGELLNKLSSEAAAVGVFAASYHQA
jgi:phosphatidylethanolamine-binding protein (PEBP) family uncharacterized protein